MLRRRLHDALSSTSAPPILFVTLVATFFFLAFQPHGSRGSVAEAVIDAHRPRRCGCGSESNRQTLRFDLFNRADGGIDIRSSDSVGSYESGSVDQMVILVNREDSGFYAPTAYNRWAKIIGPSSHELLHRQNELREQLINQCRFSFGPMSYGQRRAALINGRVAQLDGLSIFGVVYNAMTLLLFALLGWSLRLNIPRLSHAVITTVSARPLADQCPHCRYSTIGLTNDVCPECGNCISRSD